MEDIDIARNTELKKINEIALTVGIDDDELELYGKYKAKISLDAMTRLKDKKDGKLILVTAINPTPLGEGKTTMAIGLADGLRKLKQNAILALREPSLGPVFGIKGGATGGGHSQIAPMEDINLHFTGDIHAITTANNLLSAIIDNHIWQGNELEIEKVTWKRCLDLNDRALRKVQISLSGERNMLPREDGFDITVASEIMAILCLAKDMKDLKRRLGNIIIGYNKQNNPITCKDLKAEGSLAVILKDAINPNLVQTLENNPVLIHGGPFANIAHGCNSVIATNMALKMGDYVITEAGFGADLGAEKFLDIKCRLLNKKPNAVVIVATLRALKYHGGVSKEECTKENVEALKVGIQNLLRHIENVKKYGVTPIVAINKFSNDTEKEIETLKQTLEGIVEVSLLENWEKGGEGGIELAKAILRTLDNKESNYKPLYTYDDTTIEEKIETIATKIYGADKVVYTAAAARQKKRLTELGYGNLPICMAKNQYSLSDDPKKLGRPEGFDITIREIYVNAGAGFLVALTGDVMTMPGLPKKPAAEGIDVNDDGVITGLF